MSTRRDLDAQAEQHGRALLRIEELSAKNTELAHEVAKLRSANDQLDDIYAERDQALRDLREIRQILSGFVEDIADICAVAP